MIGTLRFVGLLNAGVWFGSALFFTLAIGPAPASDSMTELLGPRNFPYFSQVIYSILATRFYYFQLICAIIAILHLLAEWVYFGKSPRKVWVGLLLALLAYVLVQSQWLQPNLRHWHTIHHAVNLSQEARQKGGRTFATWHTVAQGLNFLAVCSLGLYFWRVANPPDPTRFLSTTKFRG